MELKLIKIQKLEGCLELRSGLRVGASEGEIRNRRGGQSGDSAPAHR